MTILIKNGEFCPPQGDNPKDGWYHLLTVDEHLSLQGEIKSRDYKIERLTSEADNLRRALYEYQKAEHEEPTHLG